MADAKRGDFSITNEGYAQAWLRDASPLAVDAVTASPYLGVDALAPLFEAAWMSGRGVFVLAATSNEDGRELQRARTSDGGRVEDLVLRTVAELNHRDTGLGSIGVVLGATRDAPGPLPRAGSGRPGRGSPGRRSTL